MNQLISLIIYNEVVNLIHVRCLLFAGKKIYAFSYLFKIISMSSGFVVVNEQVSLNIFFRILSSFPNSAPVPKLGFVFEGLHWKHWFW